MRTEASTATTRPRKRITVLSVAAGALLLGCVTPPRAEDGTPPAADAPRTAPAFPHPCHRIRPEQEPIVDDAQALLEETGCRAALWFDGLFGTDEHIDAARRTHGYIETALAYSQFEGFKTRTRLRVRFELPNLEERLSAFLGREDEEDFIQDRAEGFALRSQFPRVDDSEEWLAGLGYTLPDSKRLQTSFKVGAASLRRPRAFVQARLHYNLYADPDDLVYLRVTPFWRTRDGLGVTLGADFNHIISAPLLLRLSHLATLSESITGMDWLSALILYRNLRDERAIAYQLFARGNTDAPEPLYEYGGRAIYRHPLLPQKLYGELIAGYSWPRTDPERPRNGSYEIGFGLELPFGRNGR